MDLCARCLGRRLIGALGQEAQQNAAREDGRDTVAPAQCGVCEGAFTDAEAWLAPALAALADYEAGTFQVGTIFPTALEQAEKGLDINPEIGDTMRTEANRWLGPRIAEATGMTWLTDGRPDVVVTVDTRFWTAAVRANSIFIAGNYTKLRRDLPQTHWPCKTCQGRGCYHCDGTGTMYASSVEDVIAAAAMPTCQAAGVSFHGAGREDIDALMLGAGRPFVLELHDPRVRSADLASLEGHINAMTESTGVGITGLRPSDKDEVVRIKETPHDKEYLAHCISDGSVDADALEQAAVAMTGALLEQRTPQRVAHRRADLVRKRRVHAMTVETPPDDAGTRFAVRVHADSGAYIKEMVSGDEGRTTPCLAAALGVPTTVEFLDVVAILPPPGTAPQ